MLSQDSWLKLHQLEQIPRNVHCWPCKLKHKYKHTRTYTHAHTQTLQLRTVQRIPADCWSCRYSRSLCRPVSLGSLQRCYPRLLLSPASESTLQLLLRWTTTPTSASVYSRWLDYARHTIWLSIHGCRLLIPLIRCKVTMLLRGASTAGRSVSLPVQRQQQPPLIKSACYLSSPLVRRSSHQSLLHPLILFCSLPMHRHVHAEETASAAGQASSNDLTAVISFVCLTRIVLRCQ